MLCRNLRSSAVSTFDLAFDIFADAAGKPSCQQSERGLTEQTLLRHRGPAPVNNKVVRCGEVDCGNTDTVPTRVIPSTYLLHLRMAVTPSVFRNKNTPKP
jgi:hypothetical protein